MEACAQESVQPKLFRASKGTSCCALSLSSHLDTSFCMISFTWHSIVILAAFNHLSPLSFPHENNSLPPCLELGWTLRLIPSLDCFKGPPGKEPSASAPARCGSRRCASCRAAVWTCAWTPGVSRWRRKARQREPESRFEFCEGLRIWAWSRLFCSVGNELKHRSHRLR